MSAPNTIFFHSLTLAGYIYIYMDLEAKRDLTKLKFFGKLCREEPTSLLRRVFEVRMRKVSGPNIAGTESWCSLVLQLGAKYLLSDTMRDPVRVGMLSKQQWEELVKGKVDERVRAVWNHGLAVKTKLRLYRELVPQWEEKYVSVVPESGTSWGTANI